MRISHFAFLAYCATIQAAAIAGRSSTGFTRLNSFYARDDNSTLFSIPQGNSSAARANAIETKRAGFLYGPDPVGSNVYFPDGPLGKAAVQADLDSLRVLFDYKTFITHAEGIAAGAYMAVKLGLGGIKKLEDYNLLYAPHLWALSIGNLFDSGMQENYEQDLLFSMERLSTNAFSLQRLDPSKDQLPWTVDDSTVQDITGTQLDALFKSGSLFYIDYSDQLNQPLIDGRHAAGSQALFYIDSRTSEFLPLAIKTNAKGSQDLVYTPKDSRYDWLLAKMAFNQNDQWYIAFYHFASTHFKAEIVYEAAIRTLSDDHPVLAVMKRGMYQAFSLRPKASEVLTAPHTGVDKIFASDGPQAAIASQGYYDNGAGKFLSNYLETSFKARGLVNCTYGPEIKNFPFYEDASIIVAEHRAFYTALIDAYYPDSNAVANDAELQAWLAEAGPAKIVDFPQAPLNDKTVLIEMLTHMAYLSSVEHQVLNTNDPAGAQGQLPFHPAAFSSPLPTQKGIQDEKDLIQYLPGQLQSVAQLIFWSSFARPQFENSPNTLSEMWQVPDVMARMPASVVAAAATFKSRMDQISSQISSRSLDNNGLSQGMPFVWRTLDPHVIPWFFAI